MKNKLIAIILIAGISVSCNSGKKATANTSTNNNSNSDSAIVHTPADGRSFETAIIINKNTEKAGINAEYQWIREHYSNYHVVKQAIVYNDDKRFDVITIEIADGSNQDIYFDITKFFGHL